MSFNKNEAQQQLNLKDLLVHPNYIMRIGGEPISKIKELESGETIAVLKQKEALNEALSNEVSAACDELESLIPSLEIKESCRAAINLKRALFNRKRVKDEWLLQLQNELPSALQLLIKDIDSKFLQLQTIDADALQAYDNEVTASAEGVHNLLEHANLSDGLSYSNPDLKKKLIEGVGSKGQKKLKQKEKRNQEDALLQYYARCSTKTSPLSSFTVAHVGQWQNNKKSADWQIDFENTLERRVEFKAGLMQHLLSALIDNYPLASTLFKLQLNSSLDKQDGKIKLFSIAPGQEGSGRTWGTGLVESGLNENAIIQCVEHVLNSEASGKLMVADICQRVCEVAPKLTPENVNNFIGRLYQLKYLVPDTNYKEQQDHLQWGMQICNTFDAQMDTDLSSNLVNIRDILSDLLKPDCQQRDEKILAIRSEVENFATKLGVDKDSPLFRPSFYENCYLQKRAQDLDVSVLEPFYTELSVLHKVSFLLDFNQEVRSYMSDFFVAKFGVDGICSNPQAFLEEFDEVYSPGVIGSSIDKERAAPQLETNKAMFNAKEAFDDLLVPFLQGNENVQIDPKSLDAVFELMPNSVTKRSSSYSYAVQITEQKGNSKMVLNQVFGGRSSIMSRFMEVLDDAQIEKLQHYLEQGSEYRNIAELSGVFGFNANRHPSVINKELVIPPFASSRDETQKLFLKDLSIAFDQETHTLVFKDHKGKKLDLWYQGLLIPSLLPRLHRLLSLGFTDGPSLTIIKSLIERKLVSSSKPGIVPRVSLGNLVLFRRSWIMPYSCIPKADMPPQDFFFAIQQWKEKYKIPTTFFLRALPLVENKEGEAETNNIDWENINFKDMKPFYVDLDSPRFTRLMQRMLKRNGFTLCISELLPDLNAYASNVDSLAHVSEMHFELTKLAETQAAKAKKWHVVRVAYFDQDKTRLMLEPITEAIEYAKSHAHVEKVMMQPHWKFGPHVDVMIYTDDDSFNQTIYPHLQMQLINWLTHNPSTTALDPQEYEVLSRKIGMFELERGPFLPLLENNSVSVVDYAPSENSLLDAFSKSKEQVLSDSTDLLLELLKVKQSDPDAFFMALLGMLAITGHSCLIKGLARGYMSLRSHADYFFSAHDRKGQLKANFDQLDERKAKAIDELVKKLCDEDFDQVALPKELQTILQKWHQITTSMTERHVGIVEQNHAQLSAQTSHLEKAESLKDTLPEDFVATFSNKSITELGEFFINSEEGQKAQKSKEFMVYRTNVNFFYLLLPILEVSPIQKFCLCHLIANSAERIFNLDWRELIGLSKEETSL
ncbi:lantibiotic dehydratase [Glaciecola sp. MH2013]|uniref:lantibiotic dehydratase n=1 Tax=Glaciecola sp. MH2013 TaxID=2785524 RepID=UPI00189E018E|nr:lantibiotic dehydratase [Glaciecola sp. MH2013]MBF7073484.1 lantibiotic dehydratase [Glaciecola sp. MH2013]